MDQVIYANPAKIPVFMSEPGPLTREEIQERSESRGIETVKVMGSIDEALENGFIMEIPGRRGIFCPTLLGIMVHNVDWGLPN